MFQRTAHTGYPGDGKLFVSDMAWAAHIGTSAIGETALPGESEAKPSE